MKRPRERRDGELPSAMTSAYGMAVLMGMRSRPMYGGSVPQVEVQRRRASNKRARAARRVNRRGSR